MKKDFSLYLVLARFAAAILVVIVHFCQNSVVHHDAAQYVPQLGREAVIVFFVLSGFAIAYTSRNDSVSLRQYAVARCARIYSVALPILLVTYALVALVALVLDKPVAGSYQLRQLFIYVPLHLSFAGELWGLSETPPWLLQYWSLGYEVWYYVLSGALTYAGGKVRTALVAALLLIMGPKLWLLLPVWMSGVYLYRYQAPLRISVNWARCGWAITLRALVLYKASGTDVSLRALGSSIWPFPSLRLGSADRYLADYVTCAIVYANFLFARQAQFSALAAIATPIRAVAAYTFTLYLIHGPVMGLWRAFYRHDNTSWSDIALLSLCIGAACYLVGYVTERRKLWWQHRLDRLFSLVAKGAVSCQPKRSRLE